MVEIIEHGGEVYAKQYDDCRLYDRIEIRDGVVKCINKNGYSKDYYPLSEVDIICTHTSDDEESADWW